MKNTFLLAVVAAILFVAVLGCGSLGSLVEKASDSGAENSNKTLTDKAVDTAVGDEKTGIPECDEVINLLAKEADNPDDNFIVKAGKATFRNRIKQAIKESIEKNKNDKVELSKTCVEFKKQYQNFSSEGSDKSGK